METQCHNCKHRTDPDRLARCLKCVRCEDESYHGKVIHLHGKEVPAQVQTASRFATNLPHEVENELRTALCCLFGLQPIELLAYCHLVHGGKLSTFGGVLRKYQQRVSRYRGGERAQAHAMKEALKRRFPEFAHILSPANPSASIKADADGETWTDDTDGENLDGDGFAPGCGYDDN